MSGMDEHDHRMAVPLGPEMEAKWRESVRFLTDTENLQWSNEAMARVMATLDVCRAEATAAVPLDVERLAQAMVHPDRGNWNPEQWDVHDEAQAIAAAYARLASADAWQRALSDPQFKSDLDAGLEDAKEGRTKPWSEIRRTLGEHDQWPDAVSDGLTLPCSECGEVPRFDYHVTEDFWKRWAPERGRLGVVCLPCFDGICGGVGLADALVEVQWTGTGHTVVLVPSRRYEYAAPAAPPHSWREM